MEIRHPLLDNVVAWAGGEDTIRAVVITGSRARADDTIDEYSDLDVQIIARDIKAYTTDDSWLDSLGEVWIRFPLNEAAPYRLVWFAGGHKVDFQFVEVEQMRAELDKGDLSDEYQRGYIVALDKDGLYRNLPDSPYVFPAPPPPSADEVLATINEFWFEAIHVAQFIRRREFWVVKYRDWTMKLDLLRVLEWHARAKSDSSANTWLLGKRVEQWADEEAVKRIGSIWTGWDANEIWRGLFAQLTLFRRVSSELCATLGIELGEATLREIERYIRRLHSGDDDAH